MSYFETCVCMICLSYTRVSDHESFTSYYHCESDVQKRNILISICEGLSPLIVLFFTIPHVIFHNYLDTMAFIGYVSKLIITQK